MMLCNRRTRRPAAVLAAGMVMMLCTPQVSAAKAQEQAIGTTAFAKCEEYINVRSKASKKGKIIGKIYPDCAAEIIGVKGKWYQVKSGNVKGYIHADYLVTGEEAEQVAERAARRMAVVYPEFLNIRTAPAADAGLEDVAVSGQELKILSEDGDWLTVALGEDRYGYVHSNYVTCHSYFDTAETLEEEQKRLNAGKSAEKKKMDQVPTETVEAAAAPVYVSAETFPVEEYEEAEVTAAPAAEEFVEAVPAETEMSVYTEEEVWEPEYTEEEVPEYYEDNEFIGEDEYYEDDEFVGEDEYYEDDEFYEEYNEDYDGVELEYEEVLEEEDLYGYEEPVEEVPAENDVEPADAVEPAEQSENTGLGQLIADYGLQFVGNPYVYGGTSLTDGADCSGFSQSVFSSFGISLNRTAADQSCGGNDVSMNELEAGDLLFYGDGNDIGHVAIYIGDGQIVHASTEETGIRVSDYNYEDPVCAKRYW